MIDNTLECYEDLVVAIYRQACMDYADALVTPYKRTDEPKSFLLSGAYGMGKAYGEYLIDNMNKTYEHFKPLFDDLRADNSEMAYISFEQKKWNMDVIRKLTKLYKFRLKQKGKVEHGKQVKNEVCITKSAKRN